MCHTVGRKSLRGHRTLLRVFFSLSHTSQDKKKRTYLQEIMSLFAGKKPKGKLFIIIGAAVGVMAFSITMGVVGTRKGDENCDCIKPRDSGWRGFSITWFILTLIMFIGLSFWVVTSLNKKGVNIFEQLALIGPGGRTMTAVGTSTAF